MSKFDTTISERHKSLEGHAKRSKRNDWIEEIEQDIVELCPMPTTYDVNTTQGARFTEYTYTEYLGGAYLKTQCTEINVRMIEQAMMHQCDVDHISKIKDMFEDKYELKTIPDDIDTPNHVMFLAGSNLWELINDEAVSRIMFEVDGCVVKPHPLTNDGHISLLHAHYGKSSVIGRNVSGVKLLKNCEVAYVTTATELASAAVMYDKEIVNISKFFGESIAAYYPITIMLMRIPKEHRKEALNNIIGCEFSGILFPWMDDIEGRMKSYYQKTLDMRELMSPRASPATIRVHEPKED